MLSSLEGKDWVPDSGVEVAFVGRSNVGKSSAINAITNQKSLARTSKTPGRTQLLVFFELLENIRLRKLLGFREKSQLNLTAAEVIGENPHDIVNGFLLNAGFDRGLYQSAPVLTADGLVGRIINVDNDHSICQMLLDPVSRVSAKIQRNRELGVIAWDGGKNLKLLYIMKTIEVFVGDVIITSGMSQIFPENIKIGVVVRVSQDKTGMFQEISVQPSVNFNRLEEVQVQIKENTDGR